MVKDAEANADSDKKRRALVEAKNQAESLVHQTEKTIADLGADISETDKFEAQNAIADVKQALEGEDKDAIEQRANALQQIAMKMGEAAYRKAQEKSAGAPDTADTNASSNQNTDDVLDADFTEVKDDDSKKSA